MKIRNYIKSSCLGVFLTMVLTGCSIFPNGAINNADVTKEIITEIPAQNSQYVQTKLNNYIKVDSDVYTFDETGGKQFKTCYRMADEETANKRAALFAQGNDIVNAEKNEVGTYIYTYSNGSRFADNAHCSYFTQDSEKRHYHLLVSGNNGNPKENFPLKELEDFPLDQAVKQVRQLCEDMEIELSANEPQVFALDVKNVTKRIEQEKTLGYYLSDEKRLRTNDVETYGEKIIWNQEDEVYYMIFQLAVDGYTFPLEHIDTNSYYSNDHKLEVVVGRNEIKMFSLSVEYGDKEWKDLKGEICSSSDALHVIASSYPYSYALSEDAISNVELVYIPVSEHNKQNFLAKPYWQFTVEYDKEVSKNGVTYNDKVTMFLVVDAVNKTLYKLQ